MPDEKVLWSKPFPNYKPPNYTSDYVNRKDWADTNDPKKISFNVIDGNINRKSYNW